MKHLFCSALFSLLQLLLYSQHNTAAIDSLLRACYTNDAPGATILISKNNQTVFKKSYGLANVETKQKISSSTHFNIGSLTKQFTAFCIVQMASKKQLLLTDKLIKYFPDFNAITGNITIEQLLTHSSGIIDHYAFTDTNLVKHATDNDVLNVVKNIDHTYFTPGTKYRYSNTAYCLLAMVIEKISGIPYRDYISKNIFTGLSMKNSMVLQMGKAITNQALGYEYDSSKNSFSKLDAAESIFFSTEGDGGIYTSADEYMHWFQSLQNPLPANKAVVSKVRSPHFLIDTANRLSYGYGWFISEKNKDKAVYHTGSNGGFRAIVFSIPAENYCVVIFSNRTGIDLENLVHQINIKMGVTNNSFTKTDSLVSFIHSSPIFAECKEIL